MWIWINWARLDIKQNDSAWKNEKMGCKYYKKKKRKPNRKRKRMNVKWYLNKIKNQRQTKINSQKISKFVCILLKHYKDKICYIEINLIIKIIILIY